MTTQVKAVGLLSDGLDSALALRMIKDQGVEVVAVHFLVPFADQKRDYATDVARDLDVDLTRLTAAGDYIELVRHPSYGRGRGMNPCIDCRIYMIRKAWDVAQQVGARFLVTGDVLGQRPMTQHQPELQLQEKEAGLEGLIVRPLSAKLLPRTLPEQEGWVDRERLLALKGRTRRPQLALARELGIARYRPAAGGCLLTHKEMSFRLQELFRRQQVVTEKDIELLKIGRHFFLPEAHIIVQRNEREHDRLLALIQPHDRVFQAVDRSGPTTILRGVKTREAVEYAMRLTARYSKPTLSARSAAETVVSLEDSLQPDSD